jgi:hypothetical protein
LSGLRRRFVKQLAAIALAYLLMLAGLYVFQRQFIYPAPAAQAPLPSGHELVVLETADGLSLAAAYRPARAGRPTVVFFHGNGDNWGGGAAATERLAAAGFGVLLPEYRGYAGNPGSPSEAGLYQDGRAALAWLGRRGIAPERIVIIGNSLGSGVATQMAIEHDPAALVLISPFTSLAGVAEEKLWWTPARWLVRDRFDNLAKIGRIDAPVLVLHGDQDGVIPFAHGRPLAAAARAGHFVPFAGIGHELAFTGAAKAALGNWLAALEPASDD